MGETGTPFGRYGSTPAELAARLAADRRGQPYCVLRDGDGVQRLLFLDGRPRFTIGRLPSNDVIVDWDPRVSRAHAVLEDVGRQWTLVDDGLSSNGSFVNGERVKGRRRLVDGDVLRLGDTVVGFRDPGPADSETAPGSTSAEAVALTPAQRRVLVALCRPFATQAVAVPASNREVAAGLWVSVEAVRTQLRALFERFGVPDLPQNRKRAELARRALVTGVVRPSELEP